MGGKLRKGQADAGLIENGNKRAYRNGGHDEGSAAGRACGRRVNCQYAVILARWTPYESSRSISVWLRLVVKGRTSPGQRPSSTLFAQPSLTRTSGDSSSYIAV